MTYFLTVVMPAVFLVPWVFLLVRVVVRLIVELVHGTPVRPATEPTVSSTEGGAIE